MSFLEMKARIEKIMPEIFEKYAGPDELWVFAGASDKKLAEYQKLIKKKPKAGAKFVYNKAEADIKTVAVDPRARYEAYVDHILNQVYLGGQTPIPKLLTTPGFTEASANAAIEVSERHVTSLQRFLKRTIEHQIFVPIIEQSGLDPKKAQVRLNWGMPEKPDIETLLPMLANIAKDRPDIISTKEFRKILIDMGLALDKSNTHEQSPTAPYKS
jgi:hypothetical protein